MWLTLKDSDTVDEFYKYLGEKLPEVGEVIEVVRFLRDRSTRARVTRRRPPNHPAPDHCHPDRLARPRSDCRLDLGGAGWVSGQVWLSVADASTLRIGMYMRNGGFCRLAPYACHWSRMPVVTNVA